MLLDLTAIPEAFHLPRPNWDVIRTFIETKIGDVDRPHAWREAARQWLAATNRALGGAYGIVETESMLLFQPTGNEASEAVARLCQRALATVMDMLGSLAGENWDGPLAILLFDRPETYYSYVAQFYPEGNFGSSGGMCFQRDYVHIALYTQPLDRLEPTIAHEITHACLSHLELPAWLEEGVTQAVEESFNSRHRFSLDDEQAVEIKQYWRRHGLQSFWWGGGFHLPDEGQGYSYQLSRILFQLLLSDHRGQFIEFVRDASAADAGDHSARRHLGKSVADLAAIFLGKGDWTPVPPDPAAFVRRSHYHLEQGDQEQANADLTEAIRLDPRQADAYSRRGYIGTLRHDYARAIADYEHALQLDAGAYAPRNNLAWLLATCPDENIRNGTRAVELATRACELSGYDPWYCLGTLAAAQAEAGDFEEARRWAKESLRCAPPEEREACKQRLQLYKADKPYRETPVHQPQRSPPARG
ncbi:MAG: hypothetical protein JNM56_14110 [Planctomycetia bacterium]|nr:hypothetical protein [Planctomycetia bacterium]